MRTNIVLDDQLIERAQKLTGIKTKRELVHEALRTLIQRHLPPFRSWSEI